MKLLTLAQLRRAYKGHKYVFLYFPSGYKVAVNTGVAKIANKKIKLHGNNKSEFISCAPCNFHEYISHKTPFL